jgi:hypothetical protein
MKLIGFAPTCRCAPGGTFVSFLCLWITLVLISFWFRRQYFPYEWHWLGLALAMSLSGTFAFVSARRFVYGYYFLTSSQKCRDVVNLHKKDARQNEVMDQKPLVAIRKIVRTVTFQGLGCYLIQSSDDVKLRRRTYVSLYATLIVASCSALISTSYPVRYMYETDGFLMPVVFVVSSQFVVYFFLVMMACICFSLLDITCCILSDQLFVMLWSVVSI